MFCDGVECFVIEVECSVTEWSVLLYSGVFCYRLECFVTECSVLL